MRETRETTFSICAGTTFVDGMVSKMGDRYEATFDKFDTIRDTEKPVILNEGGGFESKEGSVFGFERIDLRRSERERERKWISNKKERERERGCDFVKMVRFWNCVFIWKITRDV